MHENNIRMSRISHPRGTGWAFLLIVAVFAAIGLTLSAFAEPSLVQANGETFPSAAEAGQALWQSATEWVQM